MLTDEFLTQVFDPDTPLPASRLTSLSELEADEVERFRQRWQAQPADVRAEVIDKLSSLAEDNAETNFDAIFRLALADPTPELRIKGVDALWECSERWLLNQLLSMAEDDLDPEVRAAAASHLEKFVLMGLEEELRPSLVEKIDTTLRRILANQREDVFVRRRAIEALSPSEDDDINDIIREAYHSIEPDLKLGAIYAMGQHCDPQWLPVLLTELKSTNPEARYEAARACGALEDERAVPALIELSRTSGPDPDIQEAAITALGQIGGAQAKKALQDHLNQGSARMKEAARAALEELQFGEDPLGGLH